jgi:hypothetical protein
MKLRQVLAAAVLSLVVVAPLASATESSAPRRPSFAGPKNYKTAKDPLSVGLGDLNGDGRLDIATANYTSPATVSVLLNRGDGRFLAQRVYRTRGEEGSSVAIGDLNGDGKPDLAAASHKTNAVAVLVNRGQAPFAYLGDFQTGRGPAEVGIGDLNGDGKSDLVTANDDGNSVTVLLNHGDGSFAPRRDYRTGSESTPGSLVVTDLNGDRTLDLATANFADTVSVFLNNGDGTFRPRRDNRAGSGPRSIAVGYLNRDRKPDLVTANTNTGDGGRVDSVSVLLNRGDGSFGPKVDYRIPGVDRELGFDSVAVADLNGDAKPDLVIGNDPTGSSREAARISVLVGRGDGRFRARFDYGTPAWTLSPGPRAVAVGDLNGDRRPDLVFATYPGAWVSVLLNALGRCGVPNVRGATLEAAKRAIARGGCRVGRIRSSYSNSVKRGRVISQRPLAGVLLPRGGKVNLIVSRGRRG